MFEKVQALAEKLTGTRQEIVVRVRPTGSVWAGCSTGEMQFATAESLEGALAALEEILTKALPVEASADHCDHPECNALVAFRCCCGRCMNDDSFHSCFVHRNSEEIAVKHRRIYPSYQMRLVLV